MVVSSSQFLHDSFTSFVHVLPRLAIPTRASTMLSLHAVSMPGATEDIASHLRRTMPMLSCTFMSQGAPHQPEISKWPFAEVSGAGTSPRADLGAGAAGGSGAGAPARRGRDISDLGMFPRAQKRKKTPKNFAPGACAAGSQLKSASYPPWLALPVPGAVSSVLVHSSMP